MNKRQPLLLLLLLLSYLEVYFFPWTQSARQKNRHEITGGRAGIQKQNQNEHIYHQYWYHINTATRTIDRWRQLREIETITALYLRQISNFTYGRQIRQKSGDKNEQSPDFHSMYGRWFFKPLTRFLHKKNNKRNERAVYTLWTYALCMKCASLQHFEIRFDLNAVLCSLLYSVWILWLASLPVLLLLFSILARLHAKNKTYSDY